MKKRFYMRIRSGRFHTLVKLHYVENLKNRVTKTYKYLSYPTVRHPFYYIQLFRHMVTDATVPSLLLDVSVLDSK